ncbi:MAG: hypothetical protein KBA40_03985 [Candidatus Peribacteraceae bacterium]|nr:hypothetical protein [Candidatus Peribacteraceae bacterium]MBP9850462.1 hypothetical protein [Candidatus Peribacteraceae bacterium]
MSLDLIPAPIESFAVAHPGIVHGALVVGGILAIAGVTAWGLRKLGVLH